MNSKKLTIISVIVFAVAVVLVLGYLKAGKTTAAIGNINLPDNNAEALPLQVSESVYDFGTISMKNGNVTKEFTITNSTDKDIKLKTVTTSCMCTIAYIVSGERKIKGPFGMPGHGGPAGLADELIKIGESRIIRVIFDPNAHGPAGIGPIDRIVIVTDSLGRELQLEIKAIVTP